MIPIDIPTDWNDSALLTFEEFCALVRIPPRTVRDWRRRGVGPRFWRFNGTGRLYTTVAEVRSFLSPVNATR
ncbi:helix-turn-helix domain-containing protein [Nocardioides sp. CPCC 206347]|uniref:helix-turn-helix domain-containing protein n=1 Tax=unclassified Nocardioides TaxID=2615069 RepID=UPI003622DD81